MTIRGVVAVMLLGAASMVAQSATPAPDASKPADHAACMHDKGGKMDSCMKDKDGNMACCKKDKDGKMAKEMDCCKKGKCAREKKDTEKKS
jgi:hypothetical protein